MGKDTTDYVSEMVFQSDPVTVTRKARDIIVTDKHWQLLDYMEGHYVQARRRTGVTNWSILLSIRVESQMGNQMVKLLGETYGKGPLISSGLKKKVDDEIVAPLKTAVTSS